MSQRHRNNFKRRSVRTSSAGSFNAGNQQPHNRPFSQNKKNRQKQPKTIDPNLFIKKASEQEQQAYVSEHKFTDYALAQPILENIRRHGYTHPTQIQEKALPHLLEERDVIGIANTGTGKTAAFLIPLIDKVYRRRDERVLIMAPTRELAMQILDEFNIFAAGLGIRATLCIGGANINRQEQNLAQNPHFVIGTPGRLKDLINRKRLQLNRFHTIVLDEVDRMVDIGFIHDIKYIVAQLPEARHSLFFSATVPKAAEDILHQFVHNPVTVSVLSQPTSENVDQDIVRVTDPSQKVEKLHDLLISGGFDKVIIFGRTKWGIEKLAKNLQARGFKVAAIHGNKSQGQRQRALDDFKSNKIQALLATDVASRGLDIDNVTHVINYDQPATYEDYIHRIGRTGRASQKGKALTFVGA